MEISKIDSFPRRGKDRLWTLQTDLNNDAISTKQASNLFDEMPDIIIFINLKNTVQQMAFQSLLKFNKIRTPLVHRIP